MAADPDWLRWARTLQSLAQEGLAYDPDVYHRERYERLRQVAAEIAAAGSGGDPSHIEGLFAHQRGHPTPKLDVRAGVIHAGRILLVRERDDGRWSLPGGWADVGEPPGRAAERETLEEAGVRVTATKLVAFLDRQRHAHPPHPEYSYKAIFACTPDPGAELVPRAGSEALDAGFFAPATLPPLSLDRVLPAQIQLILAHAAEPALPTEFD